MGAAVMGIRGGWTVLPVAQVVACDLASWPSRAGNFEEVMDRSLPVLCNKAEKSRPI